MVTARRTACLFAALLVAATVASRVPFAAHTTAVDHDGAHFALALERFDLLHKQPHPPGYLLFLAPAAALHELGVPPLAALVAASVAFSVVGVLATWRLGRALFGAPAGAAAAVLLASSPLYWSRGELPLSYTAEAACQAVVGWAMWRAVVRPDDGLRRAGALLGLAAGVRQDLVLFVGPVALWVARGATRAAAAAAGTLAVAAALSWAVPLVALSGGLGAYLEASRLQAAAVHPYTVLGSITNLRTNARLVVTGLAWLGGAGWLALPGWLLRPGLRRGVAGRPARFLAAWMVPPLLFFGFVFAKLDYLLTLAPAVTVVLGAAVARLAPRTSTRWAALAALAAANAALFVFWPDGHEDALGYRDIAAGDALVAGYRDEVVRQFDRRDVALLVPADSALDLRTAMLELPGYALYGIDFEAVQAPAYTFAKGHVSTYPLPSGGSVVPLGGAVQTIVWLSAEPPDPSWALATRARATAGGLPYFVVDFPAAEQSLRLGAYQLVRAPP